MRRARRYTAHTAQTAGYTFNSYYDDYAYGGSLGSQAQS